jgi:hypothetical protein
VQVDLNIFCHTACTVPAKLRLQKCVLVLCPDNHTHIGQDALIFCYNLQIFLDDRAEWNSCSHTSMIKHVCAVGVHAGVPG